MYTYCKICKIMDCIQSTGKVGSVLSIKALANGRQGGAMRKLFKLLLITGVCAVFFIAGFLFQGVIKGEHVNPIGQSHATFSFHSPSTAHAHTGGICFVDGSNVSTHEESCRAGCRQRGTLEVALNACYTGCYIYSRVCQGLPF